MNRYSSQDLKDEELLNTMNPEVDRLLEKDMLRINSILAENSPIREDALEIEDQNYKQVFERIRALRVVKEKQNKENARQLARQKQLDKNRPEKSKKVFKAINSLMASYKEKLNEMYPEKKVVSVQMTRAGVPGEVLCQKNCYFYPISDEEKKAMQVLTVNCDVGIIACHDEKYYPTSIKTYENDCDTKTLNLVYTVPPKLYPEDRQASAVKFLGEWKKQASNDISDIDVNTEISMDQVREYLDANLPLCRGQKIEELLETMDCIKLSALSDYYVYSEENIRKQGKKLYMEASLKNSDLPWTDMIAQASLLLSGRKLPFSDIPHEKYLSWENDFEILNFVFEIGDGPGQTDVWNAIRLIRQFAALENIIKKELLNDDFCENEAIFTHAFSGAKQFWNKTKIFACDPKTITDKVLQNQSKKNCNFEGRLERSFQKVKDSEWYQHILNANQEDVKKRQDNINKAEQTFLNRYQNHIEEVSAPLTAGQIAKKQEEARQKEEAAKKEQEVLEAAKREREEARKNEKKTSSLQHEIFMIKTYSSYRKKKLRKLFRGMGIVVLIIAALSLLAIAGA